MVVQPAYVRRLVHAVCVLLPYSVLVGELRRLCRRAGGGEAVAVGGYDGEPGQRAFALVVVDGYVGLVPPVGASVVEVAAEAFARAFLAGNLGVEQLFECPQVLVAAAVGGEQHAPRVGRAGREVESRRLVAQLHVAACAGRFRHEQELLVVSAAVLGQLRCVLAVVGEQSLVEVVPDVVFSLGRHGHCPLGRCQHQCRHRHCEQDSFVLHIVDVLYVSLFHVEYAPEPLALAGYGSAVWREDGHVLHRVAPLVGVEQHDAGVAEVSVQLQWQRVEFPPV